MSRLQAFGLAGLAGVLAMVSAAHVVVLESMEAPVLGLAAIWVVVLIGLIFLVEKAAPRIVAINLIALLTVLAGAEFFFWLKDHRTAAVNFSQISSHDYKIMHDVLGYAPYPGNSRQVSKSYRGETLYDTTYTIDDAGLRLSPPENEDRVDGTVLFFGGSFTFGEGVADFETLPYQVGVLTGGRFRVRNLGFHGYGPQQMLTSLQSGLIRRQVDLREPIVAIYQCGLFHARRAAGRVPWSQRLPKYEVAPDGSLVKAGFYQEYRPNDDIIANIGARSFLYSYLWGEKRQAKREEIDLMVRIVDASRNALRQLSPGAELHVIYWDEGIGWSHHKVVEGLEALGIPTHRVSSIIPINDASFRLSPYDRHPNAIANRKLAEYVVQEILDGNDQGGDGRQ